jgi:predicted DNA-binding transcriptional regulator YafY
MTDYPDQTPGSRLAREVRQQANNLTREQRQALQRQGEAIIAGRARSEPSLIKFHYRNWRGEERTREIRPLGIRFGTSVWHPGEQWLLRAFDAENGQIKEFALKDCDFQRCGCYVKNSLGSDAVT